MTTRIAPLLCLFLMFAVPAAAQESASRIRLNQVGFYPRAPKEAVVVGADAGPFSVVRTAEQKATRDTVHRGTLGAAQPWGLSGETVRRADFSALRRPGTYALIVPGVGRSHAFQVDTAVHRSVAEAALKGYYFFQRASTSLPARYAGVWARAAGHPDDSVPAGTVLAAPRGWYDAGDYNKYVVNSGISTYTLLALREHYPAFADDLETDIPERANGVPDVLDEALWNLRWMLAMQDPHDGGVYHKLTHASFQDFVLPEAVTAPRYVVQKSTTAALNFAAVMAQAALEAELAR